MEPKASFRVHAPVVANNSPQLWESHLFWSCETLMGCGDPEIIDTLAAFLYF